MGQWSRNISALLNLRAQCGFMKDGEMSTQLLFEICTNGLWKPTSGHMQGLPAQGLHKQELLDEFGTEFAKAIMYHDMWVVRDGDEIKVSRG